MTNTLKVVALCGSLRMQSYNRMLMHAAIEAMPSEMHVEVVEWSDVPPFDIDRLQAGFPPSVEYLRSRISQAHAVLLVTPEYNFSLPGMFKNLLDWLSRGVHQPFAHKPVAILSATTGPLGGARVQGELRRVLHCLDAAVLQKPEVFVGHAGSKFAESGVCTDEATRRYLAEQMMSLAIWTRTHVSQNEVGICRNA